MKKTKNLLILMLSLILVFQMVALPSMNSIASNINVDDSEEKSYKVMMESIVGKEDIYPNSKGIWINKNSQQYFLSILDTISDQNYSVDNAGYLVQEKVNEKTFNTYDEKLEELIDGGETIIVSISETYNAYNDVLNESYSIMLEDNEFTLLFEKDDEFSITILNYYHYAKHKDKFIYEDADEFDEEYFYSDAELMDKFLEVFYQDTDFVKLTENEQTQKETDALLLDENEIQYETPETEIVSRSRSYSNVSEFDAAMYGIEKNNIVANANNEKNNYSNGGILVDTDSQEIILNYLNAHCIYTYNIDENGYLICDNIEKVNQNLECKGETEIDKEIAYVLKRGLNIILTVSDSYYTNENGVLEKVYFSSEQYVRPFLNEDNNTEILYLNIAYFNLNMGYNPATSDRFVKNLFPDQLVPRANSSSTLYGETGTMNTAKTVYFGPSSSNYATVGSVDKGEDIVVMGKNAGWYFITYIVGSTSTFKSGYVPVSTVSNLSGTIDEAYFDGGYNYSNSELTVKSCYLFDFAINSGTIYSGEGFTELQRYYEDDKYISLVEYSTPSGTKRGFVNSSEMEISNVYNSTVARVIADSSPAYAGVDSSYVKLGGVYKNEFVAILTVNGSYAYAEYNTPSGRKRGYIKYSDLSNYCVRAYPKDKSHQSLKKATQELNVYGGPNSDYALIGTVFNQEIVSFLGTERNYSYVEYTTTNGAKRGYVQTSYLVAATLPTIPNIPTYANFTSGTYGTSGLGEPLKWYKIGSGSNVIFAVFEQHGWEDAWAGDGIELVNIAKSVMSKLASMSQSTFNDWTVYIIPYANPDGITDGYTNNGPGRCTVSKKIDMNRCWPGNFVPYYTSRNFTGSSSLGAPEASSLKTFINNRFGSKTNVVLDIHGWLNQTYGNSQVASYFRQQFGFSHSNAHGNGYLETWAYLQGAKSCLVELPMPSSSSSITSNNYAGKLTNGMVNLIANLSGGSASDGGTVVNELCEVSTNSSVNVRSGPGTSYSIVTSLKNGTRVTRIKKSVASANGYIWDKISLSDGRIGYMATDYLILVTDDYGYIKYRIYDEMMALKAYFKYETGHYTGVVDKQYNNELIGAVEEYQKAYGLSVQDGTINNETLTHMGFSVNSYNRIINNSFYKKYIRIANIYNDNNLYKIFIYDVEFDDGSSEPRYIVFGKNSSVTDSHYNETKRTEDSYYNSYYDLAENKNNRPDDEKLKKTEEKIDILIEEFKDKYPRAANAFQRYRDNTGAILNFGEVKSIFDIENQSNLRNLQIQRCMDASEDYITNDLTSVKMAFENYYATTIGTGSLTDLSSDQWDWYAAANSVSMGVKSTTTKSGNQYTMLTTFSLRDYYDWGNDTFYFPSLKVPSIKEQDLKDLHYCGRAKNFESIGDDYVVKTVWNENQSVDQATITVVSY